MRLPAHRRAIATLTVLAAYATGPAADQPSCYVPRSPGDPLDSATPPRHRDLPEPLRRHRHRLLRQRNERADYHRRNPRDAGTI